MATQYEQQFQAQSEQVDNLQKSLADLETKIGETKARRDLIVAKKNRAQTQESIQSAVGSLGSGMSATDKFDSLEDKIDDRLSKAEAAAELESSSLENQFRDLEAESGVDSEMEELKRKMGMA